MDALGPIRMAQEPRHAADTPCIAKTILSGKVHSNIDQSLGDDATTPRLLESGPLMMDHAQGEPMHMCERKAGATTAQRLKLGEAASAALG